MLDAGSEQIDRSILIIRGQKVLLDLQLGSFYGVETKGLNQAVNCNQKLTICSNLKEIVSMKVKVHVKFDLPNEADWADMQSLGRCMTNDPRSVRVWAVEGRPGWLAVEFTMPTEPQYKAVDKIDHAMHIYGGNRLDSAIVFPKSEAEQASAERKAERRRTRRRALDGKEMRPMPGG